MNRISKQPASSIKTKVSIESKEQKPSAKDVSSALDQLKEGKTLYLRDNGGVAQRTTKSPKWYQSILGSRDGKAEKKSANDLLKKFLDTASADWNAQTRITALRAMATFATSGPINTSELRDAVRALSQPLVDTGKQ